MSMHTKPSLSPVNSNLSQIEPSTDAAEDSDEFSMPPVEILERFLTNPQPI